MLASLLICVLICAAIIDVCTYTEVIRKLFEVVRYSEAESNERENEECTYVFFVDYLEECEEGVLQKS